MALSKAAFVSVTLLPAFFVSSCKLCSAAFNAACNFFFNSLASFSALSLWLFLFCIHRRKPF